MLKENCRQFQKCWLGWAETQMDCFVRIGTRLAEGLNEGRHVFAFGIGEDHLFAEELTARLQGHAEVIGLFPQELMTYDRRYSALIQCPEYAKVLIQAWGIQRHDLVLTFHSQDTPLYAAMEKHCRRLGIEWLALEVSRQDGNPNLFAVEQSFLPMLQTYGAQAVNAVSFAVQAGLEPSGVVHQLNKVVLDILEQFEQTQLGSIEKIAQELMRKQGRLIIMGSGHSHMLQDLMAGIHNDKIIPILESELMIFDPVQSGWTQKQRDYAQMLIDKYKIQPQDVFLMPSNTGKSVMNVELARLLWSNKTTVAVITNMKQSPVIKSDHPSGRRLFETADIVIDNCCVNKDACLELDGQRRCPLSSMTVLLSGVLLTALLAENEEG
ncbi:SIS domain-containing protein [Holdemania massiliensis]|uniref:SIS domain-containing protein n=1 Tax=Holdemania massiliensis TaxID=1468449 RepID=UPI003565B547